MDWAAAFRAYDKDGSGSICLGEFTQCLRRSLKLPPTAVSDSEVSESARSPVLYPKITEPPDRNHKILKPDHHLNSHR